jgi:hypothetical protein
MQFSKTANFQLSKKKCRLKKYSAFIDARSLLDDGIKFNSHFQTLLYIVFIRFWSFKIQNKKGYQIYQKNYKRQYSEDKIWKAKRIFYD